MSEHWSLPPSLPAAALMPRTPGGLGGEGGGWQVYRWEGEGLGGKWKRGRVEVPSMAAVAVSCSTRKAAADEGSGGQERRRHGWPLSCPAVMTDAEVFMSGVRRREGVSAEYVLERKTGL